MARRWTLEREKHNQEKKSEDEECDAPSSWTMKQMIKHGILDIYEDVQLFEEEIKNGKRVNEERKLWKKVQLTKYAKLLSICTSNGIHR